MLIREKLLKRKSKLCVVGLGYVGMPLAVEFAKKVDVIGFDINSSRIDQYSRGIDHTHEVGSEELSHSTVCFTDDESLIHEADFVIIAVPTPVHRDNTPDLGPVRSASKTVGRHLKKGAVVVYESTVYPGVTEEICIPILERESGMKCGLDFKVGYSPERINPGDRKHRLFNVTKVVSGTDKTATEEVKSVYDLIIEAGTYPVSSIKTAEAIKVTENSQRDINIAFINEMAMLFDRMGVDTNEVVDGMNTKWNALGFRPGLVGGHCIGVDPYYIAYEAEMLGYHSQIVTAGRRINNGVGDFIGNCVLKKISLSGKVVRDARVAILGITFKEDCPDIRNTKVLDIARRLREFGIHPQFSDPVADPEEAKEVYGIELQPFAALLNLDCVIFAVSHQQYRSMTMQDVDRLFDQKLPKNERILADVKGIFQIREVSAMGYTYWRL
ncbi:nucleotide sugar dehydrogenase [Porcincola sp. LCP21S3_C12]|jgi:UDP-N-acetyl-D-galactosamine dehydrogenase|uniref:nucleotide sugar dehydrogenase n=1 Tax=Porcincola sp. LCP21S3_C12 TaxID=3438798 RepID=UPI003F94D302